jgi:hypothetical protein
MLNFLRQSTGLRGAIGVMAAYALALQMLLAGMAGAQMAAADPAALSVICYGATEGGHDTPSPNSGKPVNHVTCVVCSVASLAPQLPETATPVVVRFAMATAYVPARNAVHTAARRHDPKSSQGPPQTA